MTDHRKKILLVEDDPALLRLLSKWLEGCGYQPECAGDGRQAVAAVKAGCPGIIITDWEMPHVDGVDLCRWLRQQDLPSYVYTIFLTCRCDSQDMIAALEAGADDFLKKPIDKAELIARVRAGVRVLDLEGKLNVLAKTDVLTGLATRRTFFEQMEKEWSRSVRHHIPISCVMMDIDFFKRINDTYGHRTGDQVLRGVAEVLTESCRGSDLVGRYGGEEFCVLLPETSEPQAVLWAERVRTRLADRTDLSEGLNESITASFGVAQRLADTHAPTELVDLADQALLVAKRSGRDRVVSFQAMANSARMNAQASGPGAMFDGLTAKEVMTTVVTSLNEDDTAGDATEYFLRFRFSSAPIVDRDGKLVGILSESDVMSIMLWPKWWTTQIKDIMKRNVVCYEEDTPVLAIYEFLCRVSIRGVIVVKDGAPTGIISRGGLIRWFTNLLSIKPSTGEATRHATTSRPRDDASMIADAMVDEVTSLQQRLAGEVQELVPTVVGGISRLEELIHDLLAASRYASLSGVDVNPSAPGALADTGTLVDVLAQGMKNDDTRSSHTSTAWFPPGCEPELPPR